MGDPMPRVDSLYLIHHSHTDIGYTHDQPIVWDLHGRFIDEALRLTDKYAGQNSDGAFRWTVENTGVLWDWLQHAPKETVERFIAQERQGRIEVTGMFANITPLFDTDQLLESFRLVGRLRSEYGFHIRNAMNCDVNGENWPLVDLLLDLGIDGFTMAINTHFGGAPLHRPDVFWWEGPSGRRILAYNGWPYDTGWRFGLGHSAEQFENEWWPRISARLDEVEYPIPVLMAQSYHPFGDNGPAYEGFSTFIDEWNASGKSPRLVLATPSMWWDAVRQHADQLPTYRGDWTDFWNFGSISSAREQAMNRKSRARLRAADAASAAALGFDPPLPTAQLERAFRRYRDAAWQALNLWDEHTWGADVSIRAPESEDTAAQWYHKANYAYQARSLSQMLQRDALADLARCVQRDSPEDILLFNPLPWARSISGEVPYHVLNPRGTPDDSTAGRHSQDRSLPLTVMTGDESQRRRGEPTERFGFQGVEAPGYGWAVIPRSTLFPIAVEDGTQENVVENEQFRLTFDTTTGGVTSWYDKRLDREWVDADAEYPLNGFVHEEVVEKEQVWPRKLLFEMSWQSEKLERERGWKEDWQARRAAPRRVTAHRVFPTGFGIHVIQVLEAPGIQGKLTQSTFLPHGEDWVEFESWWSMGQTDHPEATYLVFPFHLPGAQARLDLGGQAIRPGVDQIPGTCMDYYTAQGWVDFSTEELSITVALPDNPMVQLGGFHFGHNQSEFQLERAMLLGWVTNNYWETNFRAHQPGGVRACYRVRPSSGPFDEAAAHRLGLEAAYRQPLVQHLGEPPEETVFPAGEPLLRLPETADPLTPVLTLHVKPAWEGSGAVVRLLNASDVEQETCVGSGLLRIHSAQACDLLENPREALPLQDGAVTLKIPPRQIAVLRLQFER
jgi:alpha-mannosidase